MTMTYEAEQQIVKAIRSLPWYMFLVPALLTLLFWLFEPEVLVDTRPEYGWWPLMWIVAKVGFFVWVLRQLLRYAVFHWMTKLKVITRPTAAQQHALQLLDVSVYAVASPRIRTKCQ